MAFLRSPGSPGFPGFLRFLGSFQKFSHFVFNPANLSELIVVAPSEKCFVIILSVENASQRSITDIFVVVVVYDGCDRRLRDLSGGHVHAQALGVN